MRNRKVLCNPTNFSFNVNSVIQARLNRSELGEKTALILGLLLIHHYKGQLVIPDFGFYGRDIHANLIREERLIAGVYHLHELPDNLRKTVLLIDEKIPRGATVEDVEELAKYVSPLLVKNTGQYANFIENAVA